MQQEYRLEPCALIRARCVYAGDVRLSRDISGWELQAGSTGMPWHVGGEQADNGDLPVAGL